MSVTTQAEYRTGRNFIRKGDPCRVAGQRGIWMFVEVATNADGKQWANVTGPLKNPRSRSFDITKISRVRGTIERSPFGALLFVKPVKGAKA